MRTLLFLLIGCPQADVNKSFAQDCSASTEVCTGGLECMDMRDGWTVVDTGWGSEFDMSHGEIFEQMCTADCSADSECPQGVEIECGGRRKTDGRCLGGRCVPVYTCE